MTEVQNVELKTTHTNPARVRSYLDWGICMKITRPNHKNKNSKIQQPTVENNELKQPRRRRQQDRHKFAYLTMKKSSFARFARAIFHFCTFRSRSCSFHVVKSPVLRLCDQLEYLNTNFPFFLTSKPLAPM